MKNKIIAILLILLLITATLIPVVSADAGDFAGDYDFGGGDWDFDFGDDDGWDFGDGGIGLIGGFLSGGSIPIVIIVIIVAVVFIIIKNRRGSTGRSTGSSANYINVGDRSTPQSKLTPMSNYKTIDPGFDEDEIKAKMSNIYVQMQNNWTKKDFSPMRPYFSAALYAQFERQLQQKIVQKITNHVDRISVQMVELRGYYQDAGLDHIIVRLQTKIVIYTTSDETGQVITGSTSQEKFMTYEWDITRTSGMKTLKPEKDSLGRSVCPSCGAPIDINASAVCEYCGSVISSTEHDWLISNITAISQKTL